MDPPPTGSLASSQTAFRLVQPFLHSSPVCQTYRHRPRYVRHCT